MTKYIEQGVHTYIILYRNTYSEIRSLLVSANSIREALDIAIARQLKPIGIANCNKIIGEYDKWKAEKRKPPKL